MTRLTINPQRPVTAGRRSRNNRLITAEVAAQHARLIARAQAALARGSTELDKATAKFLLDRANSLLRKL